MGGELPVVGRRDALRMAMAVSNGPAPQKRGGRSDLRRHSPTPRRAHPKDREREVEAAGFAEPLGSLAGKGKRFVIVEIKGIFKKGKN